MREKFRTIRVDKGYDDILRQMAVEQKITISDLVRKALLPQVYAYCKRTGMAGVSAAALPSGISPVVKKHAGT